MLRDPVLVLGASGMLGRAVVQSLAAKGIRHRVAPHAEVDLARPESIESGVPSGVGTVINCAGWTNVDGAEGQEAAATQVNGHGVGALAQRCKAIGATLVHYSTDYVFDGAARSPYRVDHPRAPLNAYGRSKALGEELLERSGAPYLLLRTSWVYAPWGKNFVRTMIGLAQKRPSLKVVNDQRGRPSSAEQIARVTLLLLDSDARGTYHVSDAGECTWFDFAREAIRAAGLACQVEPCTSAEFPSPTRRPQYSVLDLSTTIERVGELVPWETSVRDVVARLEPLG